MHAMQRKYTSRHKNDQLLTMIFESGFVFNMTERLFQIKRAFKKKDGYEKSLSYNNILELLNRETCYLYGEITSSNNNLLRR